ncbi:hypothetical protein [Dyella sp. 2RAB6]|uniref:hypothetical protein n=1 Tax=Dyella sp. 2RAB6 TaxID=3232992 RepID=UPI003F904DB9
MRKLAIASLLIAAVAFSGSVLAQDGAAAPQTGTTKSATHHAKHSKSKGHKAAKGSKSSKKSAMPATTTSP